MAMSAGWARLRGADRKLALAESGAGAWLLPHAFGAAAPRGDDRIVLRDRVAHATAVPCRRLRGTRDADF